MSVAVQLGPTVALGRPEGLFKLGEGVSYVTAYDSKRHRFLAVASVEDSSSVKAHPLHFVETWVTKVRPIASGR